MLSDEEKNIIDLLKNIDKQKCVKLECPVVKNNIKRQLKIIELNRIIRKQSKEIEELKEKNEYLPSWVSKKYVSKDKIKEILGLEEGDDDSIEGILDYIETIVSECNRLEDIEDKKVQIEYNNVFNKGVKSVEDKIKAKIEELKENYNGDDYNLTNVIMILQSLLEKE